MIRRLIILLLIVGCVFGDTIKYEAIDFDGNVYTTSITGEYAGIYNNKVFVRTEKGEIFEIDCEDVIIIIKDDLSSVEWSCSENTYIPKILTEADIKKLQKRPIVGGICLAIGGGLLIKDLDSEEDYEIRKDNLKIAYGFIILGGILVALGI